MATPDITVKITADTTSVLKAITRALGALGSAAALTRDAFALMPAPPAPHGPGAARYVARQLAATGAHSHIVSDGETRCESGRCSTFPVLDGITPPPTPAEVLL